MPNDALGLLAAVSPRNFHRPRLYFHVGPTLPRHDYTEPG